MMVLIDARTGNPLSVLLDNGYLTDVRTGLAGALAAMYLASETIGSVGVIGSGTQARYQVHALRLVRSFSRLTVYGIMDAEVDRYITEMTRDLGIEIIKAKDAETVVRNSDLVVTTTPAKQPYLRSEWLHPGLHITCMGSDAEDKQELHADVFIGVDRIVCDKKSQAFRLGELHHAYDAGFIENKDDIIELGSLTLGQITGRLSNQEITICDLTGVGVQDTQIACLAYTQAVKRGLGSLVD
jgi:ornithine cyclodeaminase